MARIDLSRPYEAYLKEQVEAGLFRSLTAAAEHAILLQMREQQKHKYSVFQEAIEKGEEDIQQGRTIPYTSDMMTEISERGKQDAVAGKPVKNDIKA